MNTIESKPTFFSGIAALYTVGPCSSRDEAARAFFYLYPEEKRTMTFEKTDGGYYKPRSVKQANLKSAT